MSLRILKILASDSQKEMLKDLEQEKGVIERWESSKSRDGYREFNFLVISGHLQNLTDKVQRNFGKEKDWRIVIVPVETTIPRFEENDEEEEKKKAKKYGVLTREALYDSLLKGARTSADYDILVFLATLVTAIGLMTDNLAVIIGAMVIAPLLGPNLALSFGTTLGDQDMIRQALKANAVGFGLTMGISIVMGMVFPFESYATSNEFLERTEVGYGGIILAMASGAAAVLSLTSGVSSTMVGVMVAVALMPPAVTLGLALGAGQYHESVGAALLLAINITSVNLVANFVFIMKGIRPRTWYWRKKSRQSMKTSLIFWAIWLLILIVAIYLRQYQNSI